MSQKKIIVSVSNDLSNDQRVHRICNSLVSFGYDVTVLGRERKNSREIENRTYKTKRFRLLFNTGMLFYACLNFRLFIFLLFNKFEYLLANDLDTLLSNATASLLKGKKLFYDSHELFTEVPELEGKTAKKSVWLAIEKLCFKKIYKAYTVCTPIAEYYNNKYSINMKVIRNLPVKRELLNNYETRSNILIYQGALNKDRGIDIMIKAMKYLDNCKLIIAGKGDLENQLKKLSKDLNLIEKIEFVGNLDFDALFQKTCTAKLGLSIEQGQSLNYRFALPNKIFDYIQAEVPIISSDLPEMKKIIEKYKVGISVQVKDEKILSSIITELLNDRQKLNSLSKNCSLASKELNWENEEFILRNIFD